MRLESENREVGPRNLGACGSTETTEWSSLSAVIRVAVR